MTVVKRTVLGSVSVDEKAEWNCGREGGGVSNCLILCPIWDKSFCRAWLSLGPRQEEGCALGLPPLLVDKTVFGSSPHSAREWQSVPPASLPCSGNDIWHQICDIRAGVLRRDLVANYGSKILPSPCGIFPYDV